LVNHGNNLSVGLQINNVLSNMTLNEVAVNTGLEYEGTPDEPLYFGGSNNSSRVHVIHSPDWEGHSTVRLNKDISVTNDVSILAAISRGEGPTKYRACAGHWMWEADVLDRQLDPHSKSQHKWEVAPATEELVFDYEGSDQWRQALLESAHFSAAQWF